MSNIFPDDHIVNEINSNRFGPALHKINFRQMLALESIARDLREMMHPTPRKVEMVEFPSGDKITIEPGEGITMTEVTEIGPTVQHSRRRRQSGVPE